MELSFAATAASSLKLPRALTARLRTQGLSFESSAARSSLDAEALSSLPSVSAAMARTPQALSLRNVWGVRAIAADTLGRLDSASRSEEHTSELQSHFNLVCRLLLGKNK